MDLFYLNFGKQWLFNQTATQGVEKEENVFTLQKELFNKAMKVFVISIDMTKCELFMSGKGLSPLNQIVWFRYDHLPE